MLAHRKVASVTVLDPAGDLVFPVLVAPAGIPSITVEKAWVSVSTTIAASVTNYVDFTILNGGTAGIATTDIGATAGGTTGMVANTQTALAITAGSGRLTEGQFLMCKYDENGAVAPGSVSVVVEYVDGLGAARNA